MAVRLPDPSAIGPPSDNFSSGRAVGPGPENYVGPAVQRLGQSITQEADTLGVMRERQIRKDSILQGSYADANYLKERQQLVQDTTADGDYATQGKRFEEGNNRLIQKWSQGIEDPRARELWSLDAKKSSIAPSGVIANHVETNVKQQRLVLFEDNLKTYQNVYADPATDDATRQRTRANQLSTITAAQNEGLITPEVAQQWTTSYVQGSDALLAQARTKTRDGNAAVIPPASAPPAAPSTGGAFPTEDDKVKLRQQGVLADGGSTKLPAASSPAAGKVGAITSAAKELGVSPEDLATSIFYESSGDPNRWGGKGGKYFGLIQFGPEEQKKYGVHPGMTFEQQMPAVVQFLKDRGFKPGMGMMDLYSTINSGSPGNYNASDGNGTVISHVHEMDRNGSRKKAVEFLGGKYVPGESSVSDGPPPDLFSTAYGNLRSQYPGLSAQQVYALANEAVATHNSFKVEDRASLEGVVQDAPAAIQTTGGYSGNLPTSQQFTDAYGPQEGAQKYSQFQAAIGVSKTVHDMLTMPAADIQATVDASRATSGGAGAALDVQKAATIQTAAESTLKAREVDPASYTLQAFPQVKQAWTDAQQSHDFAGALRMTSAAQTQLGIPADKQALIPKGMAADIVTAGKDDTKTPAERLGAISGLVLATQDKGQRQAILQQLVKAGLPQSIDRSLDAAARGDTAGAQLLFTAATVDPTKLPGEIVDSGTSKTVKSGDIDVAVQTEIMAPGKIGDALYGISDGNIDNMRQARSDATLFNNGVKLEMLHNGGDMDAAIERMSKAVYGDMKPVNQGQVAVAAPSGIDETQLVDGLEAQKEAARQELNRFGLVNEGKTPQDKQIARMAGMDKDRHIQEILDNGVWRNVGNGYGMLDKASGMFVAGPDGKPFVVTPDQALQAAVTQTGTEPPTATPTPGQYQEMKRGGPAGRFRADFGQTPAFAAPAPAPAAAPVETPQAAPPPQDAAAASLRQRQMEVDQRRKKMGLPPFYPDAPK